MGMGTSKLVRKAHKASADEIKSAAEIPDTLERKGSVYRLRVVHASALSESDREDVWNLYESNMRALAEPSSFGWDPKAKKKELFHRDSRIILVLSDRTSQDAVKSELQPAVLAAYSTFRFDHDEDEDLLYCYELQVAPGFRKCGLGKYLMEKLMRIGKHWKMEKVMLTVLKANTSARQFYARVGFETDPISPDYETSGDEAEGGPKEHRADEAVSRQRCDYEILSVSL